MSSFCVELSEKLSQILGKGIHLKNKNCIKVSKSLGNGECYSEKASHFISISVNCYRRGIWNIWSNDNESGRTKIQYHQEFKTPAYIGEEWKAPEGLDKKRQSFNI